MVTRKNNRCRNFLSMLLNDAINRCVYIANEWLRMQHPWNDTDNGKPKHSKKPCLSVTSSKINPTRTGLELSPGLRVGTPTANRMSNGSERKVSVKMKSRKIYGFCGDEHLRFTVS
jgi:hypothetical protein